MANTISISPVTRIEGHLAVHVDVTDGKVARAEVSGEMFRGIEAILRGRHPTDAQQITQRICGVCPVSHGVASCLAQEDAYGIRPPEAGIVLRNLILGANYLQSHVLHFYHLAAVDWIDLEAIVSYEGDDPALRDFRAWVESQLASRALFPVAPFLPRYTGQYLSDKVASVTAVKHYLDALEVRNAAHRMGAIFCGKLPHAPGLVPGGVTEQITARSIAQYRSLLDQVRKFIDEAYIPDVLRVATAFPEYFEVGGGARNMLAYGVFEDPKQPGETLLPGGVLIGDTLAPLSQAKITEDVGYSRFSSASGLPPKLGETDPSPRKAKAYSWLKAPRYDGHAMEVGPLARVLVAYRSGKRPALTQLVEHALSAASLPLKAVYSTLGRHLARALEAKYLAEELAKSLGMLAPGKPTATPFQVPESASGAGLTEAPRGALGHWIEIRGKRIERYQCVVPTTWNCSPRDDTGQPGPIEQALVGTLVADPENPLEATRVVRSFDPCLACAVH